MGFIDTQRGAGHAVEAVCEVLREQGCQVAARTYRAWKARTSRGAPVVSARAQSDAYLMDALHTAAFTSEGRLAPEGLYGRRKMTAYLCRNGHPHVAYCTVDRAMKALGPMVSPFQGCPHDGPGQGAGGAPASCSTATSPRARRTPSGSPTSPTYARGRGSCTWRSSWTASPSGSWPGTPAPPRPRTW